MGSFLLEIPSVALAMVACHKLVHAGKLITWWCPLRPFNIPTCRYANVMLVLLRHSFSLLAHTPLLRSSQSIILRPRGPDSLIVVERCFLRHVGMASFALFLVRADDASKTEACVS